MTRLTERKTRLIFTSADVVRERGRLREVIIEAKPMYAEVRLAGMRTSFPISYAAIYHAAGRIAAERARAEKKAQSMSRLCKKRR